jgi:hypothetical protein
LFHSQIDVDLQDPAIQQDIDAGEYQPTSFVSLNSVNNISDVWPVQPSEKHLNVFVSPLTGECIICLFALAQTLSATPLGQRSGADDEQGLLWLKQVRSKIWGRKKDLGPKLFRTVKVTRACYAELQMRLKEKHPGRDAPDYNGGKHDIRDVKINVLQSLPDFPPPRHPDDNHNRMENDGDPEASNEDDDPDIKFPFIMRYLDLSSLELKTTKISNRLPLPLLIRQEYDYITELIEKEPQSSMGSVIISGQPGTGEFIFFLSHMI